MPAPAVAESCSNCKYWKATDPDIGECRRYPPVAIVWEDLRLPQPTHSVLPIVKSDGWCGEWAKEK